MAVKYEKETGDLVVSGFENGIAASPHKGIANIQNANISTEMGEVINSYARVQQSMTDTVTTGSLTYLSTDHVNLSITGSNNLFKGNWITVTNSSNTGQLPNGTYYVPPSTGAGFELSNYYRTANYIPSVTANTLVIGGGGAGAGTSNVLSGAGGGAGGYKANVALPITSLTAYPVVIGAGGVGVSAAGVSGSPSSFSMITADGGGGGGYLTGGSGAGTAGASGGGGQSGNPIGVGGTGTVGEGNNGGAGGNAGSGQTGSGGGGGASAVGGTANSTNGANGGNGTANTISGASVTYAGGGGGGGTGTGGSGGTGGGGAGRGSTFGPGVAGTANTGGGGGGALGGSGSPLGGNGGSGIVVISIPTSFGVTATGGTHTTSGGNDIWTFTSSGTWTPTIPVITVVPILTGFTAGLTATIQLTRVMGKPIAKATETYFNSGVVYHRYYILDNQNLVWVYDEINEILYSSSDGVAWFLPDIQTNWCTSASGIAVISGFLVAAAASGGYSKPVTLLGNTNSSATTWVQITDLNGWIGGMSSTVIPHFCYTGAQGALYITDASYIVSLFPDAALADPANSTSQNVQSFCSWIIPSGSSTQGQYAVISGTTPFPDDAKRVPVVFFVPNTGTLPNSISAGVVYYLDFSTYGLSGYDFQVFSASTGGSALDIQTGSNGVQYFNTFYPYGSAAASSTGATKTYTLTNPQVALPIYEVAQCMTEISTTILIGCKGSVIYPWDQQATQASNIIPLPEANVVAMTTVNQMAYILTGNKGNMYITDGSTASAVSSVPDYCAGIPGSPSTYIEPVFAWGGIEYIRGRVYFSILDQTTTKVGNCGGIWSFVPTQNFYIGQDVGIALRLENQNSYGTYNGVAPIIIAKASQAVSSPQYWSAWQSNITSPVYGIDFTGTGTSSTQTVVVDTDIIPTGTMLEKKTFNQIEYKLSTPLLTTDSVALNYRVNLTDAWKSCGNVSQEGNRLSGFVNINFEKTQWLQLQAILTAGISSSFVRMCEIRIR